jgi:hypothetical protein
MPATLYLQTMVWTSEPWQRLPELNICDHLQITLMVRATQQSGGLSSQGKILHYLKSSWKSTPSSTEILRGQGLHKHWQTILMRELLWNWILFSCGSGWSPSFGACLGCNNSLDFTNKRTSKLATRTLTRQLRALLVSLYSHFSFISQNY